MFIKKYRSGGGMVYEKNSCEGAILWKTDILPRRRAKKLLLGLQGKIYLAALGKPRCSL